MSAYKRGSGKYHAKAIVRHVFNKEPDNDEELAYWYGLALGFLNEQKKMKQQLYL